MRLRSLAALAALAALAGCGGAATPSARQAPPAEQGRGAVPPSPTASGSAAPGARPGGTGAPGATGAPAGTASGVPGTKPGAPGKPQATPTYGTAHGVVNPKFEGTEQEVPIDAKVTPSCVVPGTVATLTVTTNPKATLAYLAVYQGEKSGAEPPWGEGYGGNDKGESDESGHWQGSWTVRADAPAGWARVLVVVGTNGKQRAVNVPFSVGGREAGGCGTSP